MENNNPSIGFFEHLEEIDQIADISQAKEDKPTKDRDEWLSTRMGRFSGSQMHRLMTCSSKKKDKDWTDEKILNDFGDTAKNYILEVALERATGNRIEIPTTWQMQWGNDHEAEALKELGKLYGVEFEECDFIEFMPNLAGATPDGRFAKDTVYSVEVKCPATLLSHYKLSKADIEATNHTYFWQVQCEALALKADKIVFATYDPRYPEGAQLKHFEVEPSKYYQNAIITRIQIANKIVNTLIESNFTQGL